MNPASTSPIPNGKHAVSANEAFEWPREAMKKQNWSQAASRWKIMQQIYPDQPVAWLQEANARSRAREFDTARSVLADLRKRFPNHPGYFLEMGFLEMTRGDLTAAEQHLNRSQSLQPDQYTTWLTSMQLAQLQEDYDAASDYAFKAWKCEPNRGGLLIQYAQIATQYERYEEALSRWELVQRHYPNHPLAEQGIARAKRVLGLDDDQEQDHEPDSELELAAEPELQEEPEVQSSRVSIGLHQHPIKLLELIWTKAVLNLHSEVRRNYLSFGWWIIEPLMHLMVYQIVFGILLFRGGPGFLTFLMIGVVSWMWTMKCVSGSSGSILSGQSLMFLVGVPPIVFPAVALVQTTIKQIPVFMLLIIFVLINGSTPGLHWTMLVPILIVHALLNIALSLFIAALTPMVRDLQQIVPTGLTLLMFLSGIFYDYHDFDEKWHTLFLINPVAFILKSYRDVLLDHTYPDVAGLAWRGLGCFIVCGVLLWVYSKLRYYYPRAVME